MKNRYLFISEALSAPFDEGIKNVAFSIYSQLKVKKELLAITLNENQVDDLEVIGISLNKMYLNSGLRKIINDFNPDVILYLPEASITFNSFIRAKVMKLMTGPSRVVLIGVQNREYSSLQSMIIERFLRPDMLLLTGRHKEMYFRDRGLNVRLLPPAVNSVKFSPASEEDKVAMRGEYDITENKRVVLHVGHIKKSRNIECLLEVQKITDVQVVIVGSTTTTVDNTLKDRLVREGVIVIDEYIEDISRIYDMADIYAFPVISNTNAIDMPLSVLEALACNLPVVTTRFGELDQYFTEDSGFRYFSTVEELILIISEMGTEEVHNRSKTEVLSWDAFSDRIVAVCDEL